ncbi:MAG TPA: oxidoreductase [Mycobacteriales bacterium]|nr:oxidoreductase [Mycobacteriales bacterium]
MADDLLAPLMRLPDVAERVTAARAQVDRLLGQRVLRRRSAEISVEAGLRSVRASAALEGSDVDLESLRAGSVGTDDAAVQGALRVSAAVGGLAPVLERAPLQALARLHVLAAAAALPTAELGRPRLVGDPPPLVVSRRLSALADVLTAPSSASAIVVAAVVHGEVLALQPFAWGNGLVARAAARLVLLSRGVDPKALTAPEVGHAADPAAYAAAAARFAAGDVRPWVLHCADALEAGASEGLAICAALERG